MAGQLKVHPYIKTYEELRRCYKNVRFFLRYNGNENMEKDMLYHLSEAMNLIPQKFRTTTFKHRKEQKQW
jgi:hypothetical protein